jgi:hypothetical protein
MLLELCLVQDASWSAIGQRIGVTHPTAVTYTIAAIKALTEAYQKTDGVRKRAA